MSLDKRNAPLEFCPYCWKTKRDWGFRYHRACSKCFAKQQKQRIADLKARGQYNNNKELSSGVVITEFVEKRLTKQADKVVVESGYSKLLRTLLAVTAFLPLVTMVVGMAHSEEWGGFLAFLFVLSPFPMTLYLLVLWMQEDTKRKQLVSKEAGRLAIERQDAIEAAKQFYNSPEWRLLRKQIMNQHRNVCVSCRKALSESEVTIDHIQPRSKFPDKSLDPTNMQILCRSCNSSKGARLVTF